MISNDVIVPPFSGIGLSTFDNLNESDEKGVGSEQKVLYCQICNRIGFESVRDLDFHLKAEHKIPLQALPPEREQLPKKKPRLRKKKLEIPSTCSSCSKVFPSRRMLKKHAKRVHGQRVACDICSHEASNLDSLKRHKAFLHNICRPNSKVDLEPICCFLCHKRFRDKQTMESHLDRQVCLNRQKREELLREKIEKGIVKAQVKITCDYDGCTLKFSSQTSLWRQSLVIDSGIKK